MTTTSTDGRERIALTFTTNQYLLQSDLLVYGLIRWATKGLFLGEQRHYLNVDIDDWFNTSDHYYPDGHVEYNPGFQVSAHDMVNLDNRQTALRTELPAGVAVHLQPGVQRRRHRPVRRQRVQPERRADRADRDHQVPGHAASAG